MKAGRKLDALVAEKVMGWKINDGEPSDRWISWMDGDDLRTWEDSSFKSFRPSTDIAAAWEALRQLEKSGYTAKVIIGISSIFANGHKRNYCEIISDDSSRFSYGSTTPLAICLAALKAVG